MSFGRFAMWIVFALQSGPRRAAGLLDEVRVQDGHVGPGALFGAVARLERLGLIEPVVNAGGRRAYRLTDQWPASHLATQEGPSR